MMAQPLAGMRIGSTRADRREPRESVRRHAVEIAGRSCTVRASETLAPFAEHWPRSDRLGEACCHVFQCSDLLEVWLDTIGAARRTRPVFVGIFDDDDRPMMLLGLGIEPRHGGRELRFLDGGVSDYNQPILFPSAAAIDAEGWKRLWAGIVRVVPRFDLAVFEKVPATCGGLPNPFVHFGGTPIEEAGHAMGLPAPQGDIEARLPLRKVRARMLKQLGERGAVELKVASTEIEAQGILQAVMANKARQYAETGVPGLDHPGMRDFYVAATSRLRRPATVHVSALTCGDAIVASHWGLMLGDRFYLLLTAYSQEWKRYSPGALLHNALIRWCHDRGLATFDFGVGNEPYKAEYCDRHIALHRFEIPNGAAGQAHLAASRALTRLRGTLLWQRLRPIKWALIRRWRGR